MPTLRLLPGPGHPRLGGAGELSVDVDSGANILDAALAAGFAVRTLCGGAMQCRTCRVRPESDGAGLSPPRDDEAAALLRLRAAPGERLACQARVVGDCAVMVPDPLGDAPEGPEAPGSGDAS